MQVLVTRPVEDAQPLISALEVLGHKVFAEPMLTIAPVAGAAVDLTGVQALLFTSANGLRAFAALSSERGLPVFAVGDATAEAAKAENFQQVTSATGDVDDLVRLVKVRLTPAAGPLFHAAGSTLAGSLKRSLEAAGFSLRRAVLYDAQPATEITPELRRAVTARQIDAAIFFSPRTAETFSRLVEAAGLSAAFGHCAAVCLSPAVAEKAQAITWGQIEIAAQPNRDALLEALESIPGSTPDKFLLSTEDIITRFGGIRPMAGKLGVAVSTVQGWKERGVIPPARRSQIMLAAATHGIEIDKDEKTIEENSGAAGAENQVVSDTVTPAASITGVSKTMKTGDDNKESEQMAAAVAPKPRRSSGGLLAGFVLGVAVLAFGAVGAIVGRDLWFPWMEPPEQAEQQAAAPADDRAQALLQAQIVTLKTRIDQLEAFESRAAAEKSKDSVTSAALRSAVAGLTQRLDDFESRLGGAAGDSAAAVEAQQARQNLATDIENLGARLDKLSQRLTGFAGKDDVVAARLGRLETSAEQIAREVKALAAAESRRSQATAGNAALVLAVLQLRDALRAGRPFTAELAAVESLFAQADGGGDRALVETIAPLRPFAAAGVASKERLRQSFPAVARAVIVAGQQDNGGDWWAGIRRRVSDLVTIRPAGPVAGENPGAIVARAEAQVSAGDLAAAVGELKNLNGAAAEAVVSWRDQAQARVTADQAVAALGERVLAGPQPQPQPQPKPLSE